MTDAPLDDETWLDDLAALRHPVADADRAARTRARCHQILARHRRPSHSWLAPIRRWWPVAEAAVLSAIVLLYLGEAVQRAWALLGR